MHKTTIPLTLAGALLALTPGTAHATPTGCRIHTVTATRTMHRHGGTVMTMNITRDFQQTTTTSQVRCPRRQPVTVVTVTGWEPTSQPIRFLR